MSSTSSPKIVGRSLGHLPLVRHAIDALGIREVVDRLSPPDPRMAVSDGDCVAVMILNVLAGRVALYDMGGWLRHTDVDVVLGEGRPADAFHDDRLGTCLDRLFTAGTEYVFSEVAQAVLLRPEMGEEYAVHADTTSLKLEGAYEEDPRWPEGTPVPKRGYSKDHRPDLKQLIFGLSLHGPTRIPLSFSVLDGNTADPKANRFQIESLAQLLPDRHDVTLVGDCKLVDPTTLGAAREAGFHYISVLPHTYKLRRELVEHIRVENVKMELLGEFPGRSKSDPSRRYHGVSASRDFPVEDADGPTRGLRPHRFLILRSSTQQEEFESTINGRVQKAKAHLEATLEKFKRRVFFCEADLAAELREACGEPEYHGVALEYESIQRPLKRAKAGRPHQGEAIQTETIWRLAAHNLTRDEAKIEIERFHAAHFVLITDQLSAKRWPDHRIFSTWRGQQTIEGHAGFRWLKNVAQVAPVFLKLPHRIQALALVFMFALMVRNWIEGYCRRQLRETGKTLPNFNDRQIQTPTAENIFFLFRGVLSLQTVLDGVVQSREVQHIEGDAWTVLEMFGLDIGLFTTPLKKLRDPPARMGGM